MKKLIIGKKASGKTTFIVKEIIPTIYKYLVLDFCDEYFQWIKDERKISKFDRYLTLKHQVIDIISNIKDETTIIIDNANLLYFPNTLENDNGFLWLKEELKNKNYVLVFDPTFIIKGIIPDIFEDIYYFSTMNDNTLISNYLNSKILKRKNVTVIDSFINSLNKK